MEILRVENLTFSYPDAQQKAVDSASFTVKQGEFVVVCGESGCGKTTLLRLLKRQLAPVGDKSGAIFYCGKNVDDLDERTAACEIGYVLQNPDNQVVTDKVWHELAFGLESLGLETPVIRRRVAEMASYFGIQDWFERSTNDLSGGQKQMLNLASVMVMQPKVLILDEPTSQLDPIAAADFINTLGKLNKELGLTILLVEHRLEDVFPVCDKVMVMAKGRILLYDSPKAVGVGLKNVEGGANMLAGLPSAVRIFNALDVAANCPLTVREGRDFLVDNFASDVKSLQKAPAERSDEKVLELKNVWFRYERNLPDVLKGTTFSVFRGETFCLLGGNGTGKTTMLKVVAGLCKAYRGKVEVLGKRIADYKGNSLYRGNVALLPQNPQTVFLKKTVGEDLADICKTMGLDKETTAQKVAETAEKLGIAHLLDKHPYDVSGGEQQKAALAKVLLLNPQVLLLDEPTKGIDAYSKRNLLNILRQLRSDGVTVVIVTHDVEFAASCADRCALFFCGETASVCEPVEFFAGNNYYTTAANRISRDLYRNAVTVEDVVELCKVNGLKNK